MIAQCSATSGRHHAFFILHAAEIESSILFAVENEVCLRRAGDVNPLIVALTKNQ